jgi:hypothetical protein
MEKKLKIHSKEYKYFLSHGGQEIVDELIGFFGEENAGIVISKRGNEYICYINIILKRLIKRKYRKNTLVYLVKDEDYKELSTKLSTNYKLGLWGLLTTCPDTKFKVGNKFIQKQKIIDDLKLGE